MTRDYSTVSTLLIGKPCPEGSIIKECISAYSWEDEDEGKYKAGWIPLNKTELESLGTNYKSPWTWQSAWDLKGTPYWGKFAYYWGGGRARDFLERIQIRNSDTVKIRRKIEIYKYR